MTLSDRDELCELLITLWSRCADKIGGYLNAGKAERAAELERQADWLLRHFYRHEAAAHVLRMQEAIGSGIGKSLMCEERTDALGRAAA